MAIWFKEVNAAQADQMRKGTLLESLDIRIIELGDDFIKGDMPVDHRTVQPYGILHGGASVSLAESLGSIGAHLTIDPEKFVCVGMEINANHLRPATKGKVIGTARPIHRGKSSQVWSIEIKDEEGKMVCISRITMAVLSKDKISK
ncbi:hotdog fold thioesterase [Salibacteraceae bacterium]|jgi:1,4-dihydroxy-2-naphthoyl-CoA hydrolase|nr:hotdog fold thioesterase [Salibacteraceae bacterium]MDB9708930.1 hotdog fold thioesterase [Salibacteraceae bacterium]HAQ69614.1 esterase [Flavobacteriales bacterium]